MHSSGLSSGDHGIAHSEGFEQQQHYTRGEIAQGSLQGQTYGQYGSAEDRHKGSGLHSQTANGGNDHYDQQDGIDQIAHKYYQGALHLLFGH